MIDFFKKEEEKEIVAAIQSAERATSGEIRVHLERELDGYDVLDVATEVFYILEMEKTEQRNGVLFFIVPSEKQFAILGDKGINQKVPDDFWDDIRDVLASHFKNKQFKEGICKGVARVGEKLHEFFPYQSDDKNELPDEISYGD